MGVAKSEWVKKHPVFSTTVLYACIGWIILQMVQIAESQGGLPASSGNAAYVFYLIGFGFVPVMAWAFWKYRHGPNQKS
jgi:hypothetical protein